MAGVHLYDPAFVHFFLNGPDYRFRVKAYLAMILNNPDGSRFSSFIRKPGCMNVLARHRYSVDNLFDFRNNVGVGE
jgi:hypothetical protein